MTKVTTLFGDFDDTSLKKLKGYVDEVVLHMNRNDSNNQAIKQTSTIRTLQEVTKTYLVFSRCSLLK